jgi:hypothetical protein
VRLPGGETKKIGGDFFAAARLYPGRFLDRDYLATVDTSEAPPWRQQDRKQRHFTCPRGALATGI